MKQHPRLDQVRRSRAIEKELERLRRKEQQAQILQEQDRARAAGKRIPLKPRPAREPLLPKGIIRDYFRSLMQQVRRLQELINRDLIPLLPAIEQELNADKPTQDSYNADHPNYRNVRGLSVKKGDLQITHADQTERIFENINGLEASFFREFTDAELAVIGTRHAERGQAFNDKQFKGQFKRILGIDIFARETFVEPATKFWVQGNVDLIKNAHTRNFARIRQEVTSGFRQGLPHKTIAKNLRGIPSKHANDMKRIARDQMNKLNGQLSMMRQQNIGVEEFIWRTVGDDRVRDEHESLDGQKFSWNNLPGEGFPGEPIQCRCWAEPVIAETEGIF